MKKMNMIVCFAVIFIFAAVDYAKASWQGPTVVVAGSWGTGPGQFGIEHGDSEDEFPKSIGISASGKIVFADPINGVLHIFNNDGSFFKDIQPPMPWDGWPYSVIVNNECAAIGYVEQTLTFSVTTGDLIGTANNIGGANYLTDDCTKVYVKQKIWRAYSLTGQLLQTYTERPLELGQIQTKTLAPKSYQITISYPDKTYFLKSGSLYMDYVRDVNGNVYGINFGGVWRFNQCGKKVAALIMPTKEQELVPIQGSGGRTLPLDAEYGIPVVAKNGDVYTWRKTDSNYRIVKWTWVDDPNAPTGPDAPTNLAVTASINGLYLTWTASPQDPGCVTGYKIDQATTSGGHYTTIATVNAGAFKYNDTTAVAGTTYYYKIKAVSGSDYSPYTSEVSEKR